MRRALIVLVVLVLAVPLAVIAAASWFLNGDALKARLVEQVRRATGRELTIAGPVSLAWSLSPTIAMTDVALSNPPGFSQPEMAHVARIDATVALAPLLERRVVIERVAVASPSIGLERTADGRVNWDFRPLAPPPSAPSAPGESHGERFSLAVGAVDVSTATITWGGQTISVPHAAYDPRSGQVDGRLAVAGREFALAGRAGPIAETAFPVELRLTGDGVGGTLTGTSAAAVLSVTAPDLSALSPLVGRSLPPVRDVTVSAALPGPSALRIQAGEAIVGPLKVQHASLTAASLFAPGVFSAAASVGALPLTITGQIGDVAALLHGAAPVDSRIEAPGLVATAAGTLAATGDGTLQLSVQSPDLAAAGAQAGVRVPALRSLDATAGLSLSPGQVALDDLRLKSAQGDLAGTLNFANAGRPSLHGVLSSTAFDLDALTPPPAAVATAPSAPTVAPPAAPQPARLIPDTKLPLAALRGSDADLHLTVGSLRVGGATYQAVQAHAVLQDGKLQLDPVSTTIGGAVAHASLQVDAAAAAPAGMHLVIDAPALPFAAIVALAGHPSQSPGTMDLRADLTGSGDTVRAVAASVNGHAGLALVDGQIDNELLERLAAGALRNADIPLEAGGNTTLRCVALRADATAGVVQLNALTLDTSKLALDGGGVVNLGNETVDLHLRPQLRLGGGLSVPLQVRGTLMSPKVTLDPGAIASGRVGIVLGGGAPPDRCGPALALAREGKPGAAAAAAPPSRAVKPADLLRGLLR